MDLAVVALILIATAFDALRDVWTAGPRELRRGWWPRHIAKWISFYVPLVALLWVARVPIWWWPFLGAAGWAVWRFAAVKVGGVEWPSFWTRPRRRPGD